MRVLGIDYGEKRIGVALGDTDSKIATPWKVIQLDDLRSQVDEIQRIFKEERATTLVVGIPYSMNGAEGAQVKSTRLFIDALKMAGFVVHEVDERLSTRLADSQAHESNRKGPSDDLAAANILQTWLEQYGLSS